MYKEKILKNTAGKFILKNFVKMVLLIFAVSIAAFALMTVSPVDPLQANVGQAALGSMSQEQIAKLEEYWGVGEPPVQRYLAWLKDFLKGDMGVSLLYRQDVAKVIAVKLGNSLFLMIIAWVLSGLIGFALGALAGMNRGKFVDKAVKGYCLLISSTPAFWIAMLLLIVFGNRTVFFFLLSLSPILCRFSFHTDGFLIFICRFRLRTYSFFLPGKLIG